MKSFVIEDSGGRTMGMFSFCRQRETGQVIWRDGWSFIAGAYRQKTAQTLLRSEINSHSILLLHAMFLHCAELSLSRVQIPPQQGSRAYFLRSKLKSVEFGPSDNFAGLIIILMAISEGKPANLLSAVNIQSAAPLALFSVQLHRVHCRRQRKYLDCSCQCPSTDRCVESGFKKYIYTTLSNF